MRHLLAAVLLAVTLTGAQAAAIGSPSLIRVTLTAENHHPRASRSPSVHWWYCVKVTTATGESVASTIHVRIVSGGTVVRTLGLIELKKGYNRWCQAIGGEASVLNVLPKRKLLDFQTIVTAQGVTVTRSWPIIVR